MVLTERALKLVLEFEVSGKSGYLRSYQRPIWPGGESGVTIGIGYDLGYCTSKKFASDFSALNKVSKSRLLTVCGLKGECAGRQLPSLKGITVSWDIAVYVFTQVSVPEYFRRLEQAMPGVTRLHPEIQGALWSLVYNRGASMALGDRRREMRLVRDAIRVGNLESIPHLIRSMVRLWEGTAIEGGMRRRRNAEANLVEVGLRATM